MDDLVGGVGSVRPIDPVRVSSSPAGSSTFKSTLEQVLTVSAHAKGRLAERGVHFSAEELPAVAQAVDRAAQAGSKTAAVVTGQAVLVVAPATRTVITALPLNTPEMTMVNRVDTLVFLGRTSNEETRRSGRTEGAPRRGASGSWSLIDAETLGDGNQT